MYKRLLKQTISVSVLVIIIALGMAGPVSAIDHWWHGGVSENLNDPANWTDRNVLTDPTTPTGDPQDIVRIGGSWGSEDLDGDGVLDPGEDLNGNGVIDDPVPPDIVGQGGYYSGLHDANPGGGYDVPVDPVLSETYVSRNGTAEGGWWFVLNAPNILTLADGAFIIWDEENSNLRNGGRLEVQGRSDTGGPSLITAGHFRIAENGSSTDAAHETCQLRINGTGWVQVDASLDGGNDDWFRIGTTDAPGTMPRGEVIIEESGRLEVLSQAPDADEPYLLLGHADPNVNQIIIRDDGDLLLPGDPATMGRLAPDTVISLQEMIDTGLIINDQGYELNVSGINPTTISVAYPWASKPSPADGESEVAREIVMSWKPSQFEVVYDVYLGTDVNSVTEATRDNPMDVLAAQDLDGTSFDLDSALDYNQTYYWRVDAINDSMADSPWASSVWSFTIRNYNVVEDFEDYNDFEPDTIWNTWSDGYGVPTNGSSAGYPEPDFIAGEHYLELVTVHSGDWSMPLFYNNNIGISEVTRTLNADWTQGGAVTLTLFYHGVADNAPEQMFVVIDGVVVNNDDANAALVEEWTQWDIPLETLANQGVNLSSVGSITLGFGNKANPVAGGEGHVFFDDIRLYLP